MENTVTYTNSRISGALTDDQLYQAKINAAGTADIAEIAKEVAENLHCGSDNFVIGVINAIGASVRKHLAAGERVTLEDFVRFEITAEGSFESEDESWNSENTP